MKTEPVDLVFSFDSTGSMYSCIGQVRKEVEKTVKELFDNLPDLRVGIITHGDYCDGEAGYRALPLTTNQKSICDFIRNSKNTSGGDGDEFYEYVLQQAQDFNWDTKRSSALVMIGDAEPHKPGYYYGGKTYRLDWKIEAQKLLDKNISIYSVQCLGYYGSKFWQNLADLAATPKLDLNQFGQINQLLQAICYKQSNTLPEFEALLRAKATERIDFSLLSNLDKLAGRETVRKGVTKKTVSGLDAVHPSRFQILKVNNNVSIKDFVEDSGLNFKTGRGFYEFTKSVEVQSYKEIILQDRKTGDMFSGKNARKLLGIPVGENAKVKPVYLSQYRAFIQSTSNNRKLLAGTNFLYEVEDI